MSSILGGIAGNLAGGNIGRATVALALDTTGYNAQLEQAKAQTAAGTGGMAKGFEMLKGAAVLGLAAGGIALAKFAASAVQAASDQNESLNKTAEIFGNASDEVVAFSETSAESLGISKTAALDAAAGFGNMLETAGLAESAAGDMSQSLVTLAADLASFNNIDPAEALDKLKSGLAGEAEPLRTLGILLSETRVKQEAYASGLATVGAELTEAQKVQARYNLIFKDSDKAQGDFARTSTGLANTSRILKAEFADLSAELGKDLLPALVRGAQLAKGFVEQVGPPLKDLADATLGADNAMVAFTEDQLKATQGAAIAEAAFTGGAAGQKAYGAAVFDAAQDMDAGRITADEFAQTVRDLQGQYTTLGENTQETATITGLYGNVIKDAQAANDDYNAALAETAQGQFLAATATERHTEAMQEQRLAELESAGGLLGLVASMEDASAAIKEREQLERQGKKGTDEWRQSAEDATQAQLDFRLELRNFAKDNPGHAFDIARSALKEVARQTGLSAKDVRDVFGAALDDVQGKADRLNSTVIRPKVILDIAEAQQAINSLKAQFAGLGGG